jgi:hypothetical protein
MCRKLPTNGKKEAVQQELVPEPENQYFLVRQLSTCENKSTESGNLLESGTHTDHFNDFQLSAIKVSEVGVPVEIHISGLKFGCLE